jgi:hypothetical protein
MDTIPRTGDWWEDFDFRRLYRQQRVAHNLRADWGLPHDPDLIRYVFDFGYSPPGRSGPREESPPSWDNAVKAIESR